MQTFRMVRRFYRFPVVCCALFFSVGCTNSDGPERFNLSGQVTFDGKPIPAGQIRFSPDVDRGNQGPATIAKIKNGQYSTPTERGVIGGPTIVRIAGFDGVPIVEGVETLPEGTALFKPYQIEVDLQKQSGTENFDVPKSAAKAGRR